MATNVRLAFRWLVATVHEVEGRKEGREERARGGRVEEEEPKWEGVRG